jgi:hypothetical protein
MAALLASKTADAPIYIADLINRSSTSPSFLHHIETTPKAVALLATIVNSTDAVGPSAEAVAKLTTELCRNHQGRRCLCNRAPFALLSSLAMSRDEAVRTHAIASIREICHDDSLPLLPTEWLLALTRCPVIEAQRSAARALWLLSERDVDNLMSRHVLAIVALASADDPFIQSNAGKALGSLCVKEVNKKMIVRAGGAEVFINLLRAATTDIEVQRFAAKALANLSSSDRDTRAAVIRQVEERIPSWTEFDDNIVNVYLEMMFTN